VELLGFENSLLQNKGLVIFNLTATDVQARDAPLWILIAVMEGLSLCMVLFMLTCSIIAFVVFKRQPRAAPHAVTGLRRMVIFSVLLALAVAFQVSAYFVRGAIVFETYRYFPPWFQLGLVQCVMHAIQAFAFLYLIAQGGRSMKARPDASVELMTKKLLSDSDKEESSNVPKVYRI
jgi:hypothetical protein